MKTVYLDVNEEIIFNQKEEIRKLKEELRYDKDQYNSLYMAYLDMKKYAYRVGHNDECLPKRKDE